jgi:hypothetical protein
MKQTITLYIHRNMDWKEASQYLNKYEFATGDMSHWEHSNYVLIGTQEIEVEIPEVDCAAMAKAKFDEKMAAIDAKAAKEKSVLISKHPELNEVAA